MVLNDCLWMGVYKWYLMNKWGIDWSWNGCKLMKFCKWHSKLYGNIWIWTIIDIWCVFKCPFNVPIVKIKRWWGGACLVTLLSLMGLKVWNILAFSLVEFAVLFHVSTNGSLVNRMLCHGSLVSSIDGV